MKTSEKQLIYDLKILKMILKSKKIYILTIKRKNKIKQYINKNIF